MATAGTNAFARACRRWRLPGRGDRRQARGIREAIALVRKRAPSRKHPLAQPGQPFDSALLRLSPLFRRSRELFLEQGGGFDALLVSSPRSLGSITLLEPRVEYSPVEGELEWAATDRAVGDAHLLKIRDFVTSLFHEQNHRLIWKLLPPPAACPPRERKAAIRRYLNLVESLAITLDMALGDELGPEASAVFYQLGLVYDRGTRMRREGLSRREYRNYLQAALYATYLNLELYNPRAIPGVISALYALPRELAERAARRSLNLDRAFVERTNPIWQARHGERTWELLRARAPRERREGISLSGQVADNRLAYLYAEEWFSRLGL